jgi:phosphatidylglycerol---prolipoprotein diacylglyceryl transferase
MYPTLYHAVLDLTGVELNGLKLINMFGFLVALAFLAAARCLSSELARKHREGWIGTTRRRVEPVQQASPLDLLLSALMVFVLGWKFFGIEASMQGGSDAQRYLLSWRGNFWAGLACAAVWMGFRFRELRREKAEAAKTEPASRKGAKSGASESSESENSGEEDVPPQDFTMGITGAAALGGLIGAKLFHLLERPRSIIELFENPSLGAIFSGLTIYGGLIVGALFVWLYTRRRNIPFAHVCDANAAGLMLAYAIGRLGCQLSGDGDWGIPNTSEPPALIAWLPQWVWSYDYPNNVIGAGAPMASGGFPGYATHLVPPVYPTPLYESVFAFLSFGLLWYLRKRIERPLVLFGIYMMINGFARFWVEKIRVNATYDLFGTAVTQAEIIAVVLFIGGAGIIAWSRRVLLTPPPVRQASTSTS